ncbi:hypothetical protein OG195_29355 [Streptomyces sp. NBC_01362]|uniref:hypothetical protein n=1 Tax=Streptomyces sp. NBC_01362 TaxID=2903839 RepID=UPI002E32A7ED|nr:hypothetical protein [Streptomyces sp. NBC_01362]
MNRPDQPPASRPLSSAEADIRARRLIDEAYTPMSHRDDSPLPAYGPTPPVAQPGRPPMSQKATDASALMLTGSVAALSVGGATSLVLYTLGQVDPVTLAMGAAGPVALVLAAGSLLRSLGRAKADAHTEHHHHYKGPVHQDHRAVHTTTRGMWAKTTNQQQEPT